MCITFYKTNFIFAIASFVKCCALWKLSDCATPALRSIYMIFMLKQAVCMSQQCAACSGLSHDGIKHLSSVKMCLLQSYFDGEKRHSRSRDPTCKLSCVYGYIPALALEQVLILLQSQSSSGSVGKSIWPAFRRPRSKPWLDLNVSFHHLSSIIMLLQWNLS